MQQITLFDAKTHLSSIITAVEEEHAEFIITKRGKQVAKIVPIDRKLDLDIEEVFAAIDEVKREIRGNKLTLEEILRFKNEGRK